MPVFRVKWHRRLYRGRIDLSGWMWDSLISRSRQTGKYWRPRNSSGKRHGNSSKHNVKGIRVTGGSQRRRKRVKQLSRIHAPIANPHRDFAHKVARYLVNTYGIMAVEKLHIHGMRKNHHLAKSIHDAGWNPLLDLTIAKAEEAGRDAVLVNPKPPRQDCSTPGCSYRNTDLTLPDRTWQCPRCGALPDRDMNAANHILTRALAG